MNRCPLDFGGVMGPMTSMFFRGKAVHQNEYFVNQYSKYVCFGFLDTFVIAYRLYGSNPQKMGGNRSINSSCSCRLLTSSSLFKKDKRKEREN